MKAGHNLSLNITVIIILSSPPASTYCWLLPGEREERQGKVSERSQSYQAGTEPQCLGLVTLYLCQTVKRNYNVRKVKEEKSVNQTEYIQINTEAEEEEEKFKFSSSTMTFPVKEKLLKFTVRIGGSLALFIGQTS